MDDYGKPTSQITPLDQDFRLYFDQFTPIFPRRDQRERFEAYLRGLLLPDTRKNPQSMALALKLNPPHLEIDSQSLHHFVATSPWSEEPMAAILWDGLVQKIPIPGAFWVVHEAMFEKRGKNSVGVQRQYSKWAGKKTNSQIALILGIQTQIGYFPLKARLYIPPGWRAPSHPQEDDSSPSNHQTKADIALELLTWAAAREPFALPKHWDPALMDSPGFPEALNRLGWKGTDPLVSKEILLKTHLQFVQIQSDMGVDHYEGRSFRGWHHHAQLVFLAHAFLYYKKNR